MSPCEGSVLSGLHRTTAAEEQEAQPHRFPYIIYYLVEDDQLYFGALLHSARHPEAYRATFEDL